MKYFEEKNKRINNILTLLDLMIEHGFKFYKERAVLEKLQEQEIKKHERSLRYKKTRIEKERKES